MCCLESLSLRDPNTFMSGQLHDHLFQWEMLCGSEEVAKYKGSQHCLSWIKYGVDISKFMVHFKGDFKGKNYDSDIPPPYFEQNSILCKQFRGFISATLEERMGRWNLWVG